jgi:uncharacterized protein YciI
MFVMTCTDHKNALDRRLAARPAHLAYLDANRARLTLAGPLLDDEGQMAGSLFIMEADSKAEVEAFSLGDPYRIAGVFETVDIRAIRITFGVLA